MWEAATGNVALNDYEDSEYINVILYSKPDK